MPHLACSLCRCRAACRWVGILLGSTVEVSTSHSSLLSRLCAEGRPKKKSFLYSCFSCLTFTRVLAADVKDWPETDFSARSDQRIERFLGAVRS
ncbi:hypothetical protein FN846DRAFT_525715 [Sphaerosporella brunnea]|uniref:Uncharacterized protein n=1 Tax=Sphaerosporella brunnea TaxID=1250544 RepID=A0A5J5F3R7_9PEZI|nr:hypothetical protein FN846DRAFT_525715 [Sphaerosporella brunnea]